MGSGRQESEETMIVIQNSVWRADCIACIHMDEEDEGEELHVLPVGS